MLVADMIKAGCRRGALVVALAVGCGWVLTGCGADDNGLPSLGGTGTQAGDPVEVAKNYYDCMNDAGIPVRLTQDDRGKLTKVEFGDKEGKHLVVHWWRPGDGSVQSVQPFYATELSEADRERIHQLTSLEATQDQGQGLLVDWVDQTSTLTTCLGKTGYDDGTTAGQEPMNPENMQLLVEANNTWAACARDNGWPTVKDSTMPTDLSDWSSYPTVFLPGTITEDQLRQLLTVCPNFDQTRFEASQQWSNDHANEPGAVPPEEFQVPDPYIDIDISDPSTSESGTAAPGSDAQTGTAAHAKLYEILHEAATEAQRPQ